MWALGVSGLICACFVGVFVVIGLISDNSSNGNGHSPIAESASPSPTNSPTYRPIARPSPLGEGYPRPSVTYSVASPGPQTTGRIGETNDSLYSAGALPAAECPAPGDLKGSTAIHNHVLNLLKCLDKAWNPVIKGAGFQNPPVQAVLTNSPGYGSCGSYGSGANKVPFFCPTNNTIYASIRSVNEEYGRSRYWRVISLDSVYAHEYGHHIQHVAGTWPDGGGDGATEQSRRGELQAQCFSGVFMRAITGSYPVTRDGAREVMKFNLDLEPHSTSHGSAREWDGWYEQGFHRGTPAACNTWTAESSAVAP